MPNGWATRRPLRQGTPYDAAWRRFRIRILDRDGWQCQVRGPRCIPDLRIKGNATVDHVIPLVLGGARLDPANARAACRPCNLHLGAKLGRRLQGRARRMPTSREW